MKYDFIPDFVHSVVKEYDWTMPKYNKEEYGDYNEYECECLDIGHDYEYEIAEIAVDRMVRASRLSRQEAQNCGDEIGEAVWDEISKYIIANMDKEEEKR
jgi:hypothetical protein